MDTINLYNNASSTSIDVIMVIKSDSAIKATENRYRDIFCYEYSTFYEGHCSLPNFIHLISQKWTIPIILELYRALSLEEGKKLRFNELNRIFSSIRPKVLSKRLKELEREEIVTREKFNEMPLRVEYSLTEKGHELATKFVELNTWEKNWKNPSFSK